MKTLPRKCRRVRADGGATANRWLMQFQADVLGVPMALTDYEGTMDWIDASIAHREKGYVCVAATHTIMVCNEDPELREAVLNASLTLPQT